MEDTEHPSLSGKGKQMHLSFSGCGFLGLYHVGVVSCIKEYAPHLARGKVAGASAGALAACGLVTECNLGEFNTCFIVESFRIQKNLDLRDISLHGYE